MTNMGATFRSPGKGGPIFLPFGVYVNVPPLAANGIPYTASLDRIIRLIKWTNAYSVVAPNDAVNFWTLSLWGQPPVAPAVLFGFISSQGLAPNTWLSGVLNTFLVNPVDPAIYSILYILATKNNAPGALYVGGPMLEINA